MNKFFLLLVLIYPVTLWASRPPGPPACPPGQTIIVKKPLVEDVFSSVSAYRAFTDKIFYKERAAMKERLKGTTAWIGSRAVLMAQDLRSAVESGSGSLCLVQVKALKKSFQSEASGDLIKIKQMRAEVKKTNRKKWKAFNARVLEDIEKLSSSVVSDSNS